MQLNKAFIYALFCVSILAACSQKKEELTKEEKAEIIKEIKEREDFESSVAIPLTDTTEQSFNFLSKYNTHLAEKIEKQTYQFYSKNDFKTRWLYIHKPTKLFNSYLTVLKGISDFGMNPDTYHYRELEKTVKKLYEGNPSKKAVTQLDKEITASFLLLSRHIIAGRVQNFSEGEKIWQHTILDKDAVEMLLKVTDDEDLEKVVGTLHPDHIYYTRLHNMLRQLNQDTVPETIKQFLIENPKEITIGYRDKKVALLRENLAQKGFETRTDSTILDSVDANLKKAIAQFQKTMNLEIDSIPGRRTLYYLNMTKEQKKRLVILNLERIRWFNKDLGDNYIIVNIPQFKLFVFRDKKLVKEMNVIVGKEYTSTPVFSEELEYIVFRPTWTVPQSIIRKEMIYKLRKNPNHYTRKGFKIYRKGKEINPQNINWNKTSGSGYRFVQQPSASNALGLVKFIMPNSLNIYLHDTPKDKLFAKKDRAFSHGCVRVEFPDELAATLLEGQDDWNLEKVREAMYSGKARYRVNLERDYDVEFVYLTAWIDENNIFHVANDVYGHDLNQLQELETFIE